MFKLKLAVLALGMAAASTATASPGIMFGISYNFSGKLGFTVNALTSNKRDHGVGTIGVSYYPTAPGSKFGFAVGGGYNFHKSNVMVGWDFLQKNFQIGAGYVNTVPKHNNPTPPLVT